MTRSLTLLCLLLSLVSCAREAAQGPEVARQRGIWEPKGWTFVEVCGDSTWKAESAEVRLQGTQPSLTVYAECSGIDGRGTKHAFEKTFAETGYTFMEVKVATGLTDCYSIVFKRKVEADSGEGAGAHTSEGKGNTLVP